MKAWVDDSEAVKARLDSIARLGFQYLKNDVYYFPKEGRLSGFPRSGVRLRRESRTAAGRRTDSAVVTYKSKEIRGVCELNTEHEFAVSGEDGVSALCGLLGALGLEAAYTKSKKGWSYDAGERFTAELSEVAGLGWFLELEILSESGSEDAADAARERLFAFLDKTGVSRARVESRYYSELLLEAAPDGAGA